VCVCVRRNFKTGGHRVGNQRVYGAPSAARRGIAGRETGTVVVRRGSVAARLAPTDRPRRS